MPRKPDPDFDALVKVTNANVNMERGRLNITLQAIRAAWQQEGGLPEDLPTEIENRANAYRALWPTMALTPTALAVHWKRVIVEGSKASPQEQAMDELKKENQE